MVVVASPADVYPPAGTRKASRSRAGVCEVCIYIYIYIYIHNVYICICIYVHIYIYICIYIYMHVWLHASICVAYLWTRCLRTIQVFVQNKRQS